MKDLIRAQNACSSTAARQWQGRASPASTQRPCAAPLVRTLCCFTQYLVLYQRRGKSMLKQHQIVNTILAEELKQWHGLNLTTKAP